MSPTHDKHNSKYHDDKSPSSTVKDMPHESTPDTLLKHEADLESSSPTSKTTKEGKPEQAAGEANGSAVLADEQEAEHATMEKATNEDDSKEGEGFKSDSNSPQSSSSPTTPPTPQPPPTTSPALPIYFFGPSTFTVALPPPCVGFYDLSQPLPEREMLPREVVEELREKLDKWDERVVGEEEN
ncbi:hypothetical protein MMC28_004612 [Mycoblastus sanguinarius]|nr:hypothetical protein [Mycoblastus sanguinarius]